LEGRPAGEEQKSIADDPSWQAWAIDLDLPGGVPSPEPQPTPRPPVHARPRKLSVSDVGLWMTNPYGLYARRILGLKRLDPLEADPGAGDRGTIIHKALERFIHAFPSELPDDPLAELRACGQDAFRPFSRCPQVLALWWPRFLKVAEWTVQQEQAVRAGIQEILAEAKGDLVIEVPAGPFRLTARADRLELHGDGSVVIIDYKTGQPPSKKDMERGIAPQLALEGAILRAGGFAKAGLERRPLADLQFWQLSGNEKGGKVEARSTELVEEALEGLEALIRHYDQAGTAYPAAYRPPTARPGDYDHLARLGEWPN
jgi:ATP-dependent helicase/nuclease subunit B